MKKEPVIRYENVTPARAKEILARNTNNRPLRAAHLRFITDQMKSGEWRSTGDAIQISDKGRLIDGQHRLNGIIQSNTTQRLLIVDGVEDDIQDVLDTGKNRSAGDVLFMGGEKNYTIVAGIIKGEQRLMNDITSYGGDKKYLSTNHKVKEQYEKDPDTYRQVGKFAQKCYKNSEGIMPAAQIGGFYMMFLKKAAGGDHNPVQAFFEKVFLGVNRNHDSTANTLYKKLLNAKINGLTITMKEKYIYMVRTWNYELEGKYSQALMMPKDGQLPEIMKISKNNVLKK